MRKARSSTRPYLIPIVFFMLVAAVIYWQYRPSAPIKATLPGVQEIRTIRVIEAIPSDAHVAPNEKEQIRDIATKMRDWFRTETNGHVPRLNSDGGVIRVEMVKLRITSALLKTSSTISNDIQIELSNAGVRLGRSEAFLVFIAIRPERLCGEAFARTAAVFLKNCNPNERDSQTKPELVAAHELLHVFGAVEDCAPHYRSGGHVSGPVDDIMYEPRANEGRAAPVLHLDPGRDDYYGHRNTPCLDVKTLPVWEQAKQ